MMFVFWLSVIIVLKCGDSLPSRIFTIYLKDKLLSGYYKNLIIIGRTRCVVSCSIDDQCYGVAYHKYRHSCYHYEDFPRCNSSSVDVGMITFLPQGCFIENIALNKPVNTSSMFKAFAPCFGVDGKVDIITHTYNSDLEWWCVDLEKIYIFQSVVLYNRIDFPFLTPDMRNGKFLLILTVLTSAVHNVKAAGVCYGIGLYSRRNCGYSGISKYTCWAKGCCFDGNVKNTVWCFYKPVCRGRSDPEACNEYFPDSHIVLANKTIAKTSYGKCIQPDVCECKQNGFYSAGPFCDICSPINNCDLEYCTNKTDQLCHRCEGFMGILPGYQAYIKSEDHKECNKGCSWRSDSSRCYPGTCKDQLFSNCNCSDGFTGNHCEKIVTKAEMLYNEVTLTAENGEMRQTPEDVNSAQPEPISWTNLLNPVSIQYQFQSRFLRPNPQPRHAFIKDYKVGIIHGQITFNKVRTVWKWVEVPVVISIDSLLGNFTDNDNITNASALNLTDFADDNNWDIRALNLTDISAFNLTNNADYYCESLGMNGTEFVLNEISNMLMNKTDWSINSTDLSLNVSNWLINATDWIMGETDWSMNETDLSMNQTDVNKTDTDIRCSIWVWKQVNVTETQTDICPASTSRDDPNQATFACSKLLETNFSQEFLHQDWLEVNITLVVGGFVKLTNFETESNETHYFESSSLQHVYEIRFDNVPPYHCQPVLDCNQTMLSDIDGSQQTENILSWDGWMDDDGGIGVYEIEVFSLKPAGDVLVIGESVQNHYTTSKNLTFYLTTPSAYAIIFTTKDKAGNTQTARRILIFDDSSNITTTHNSQFLATTALPSTNYVWQQNHGPVTIDWENRYINTKHHNGKYLAGVEQYHDVSSEYDDNNGTRTVEPVDNVLGIVLYKTYYGIDVQGGSTIQPTDTDFTTTGNLNQSITISPTLQDGDTVKFYIRAYDIVDFYLEEIISLYFDTSPPVVKDLWLTKGDKVDISIHEFQDLNKLVIEWIAYDLHSGLETVVWKLYDNFTADVILHGSQHIPEQGKAQNHTDCEEKYQNYSRGSDCYCTPAVGCYHQHFQVKPGVSLDKGTGLIQGKDQGVHDYDYYIEVYVMNNAKLNTTLTIKITIDTSPPHVGVVHDGRYGESEVDYQPDRNLQAHWEGFFDKESGVRYYHYGFSTGCLTAEDFHFEIQNTPVRFYLQEINETSVTHATWLAPTDGQYYITVVAYNAALQPSQPVCSDGVVIDSTRPIVREIFIDQARIEAGLVSKDRKLYYINNRRQIHQIQNPDPDCLQKGRPIEDISLFPVERYPNQTIQDRDLCQEETLPIQYLTQSYLVEHSHIYVNWTGIDVESGIYDYQFGLSSERDSIPDLLPFHSTNHHTWYRGYHPQLTDGTEFFIHIKATNKAGLETIQTLGPLIVHTSKPKFTGNIDVVLNNNLLVANWSNAVVKDPGHSQLRYTAAIGRTKGGQEIIKYSDLNFNEPCLEALPPTCTVFDILKLDWSLHHGYKYYVSIKIENTVGLHTVISSESLTYKSILPSKGVVIDVGLNSEMDYFNILELEDSDYQLSTSMVSVRWYGFESEEEISRGINYKVGIKRENDSEFIQSVHVSQQTEYTFIGLKLQLHQKYIVSVTATVVGVGSVTSSSDGITVVQRSEDLTDEVELKDGAACFQPTDLEANLYRNSTIIYCGEPGYQPSSSSYSIKWNISNTYYNIYPHIKWSLQKQHQNTDIWLKEYEKELYTRDRMLTLPYRLEVCESYRSELQFCIDNVCSQSVFSEGVTILETPEKPKLDILMITDQEFTQTSESCNNVIKRLEWSITDDHNGRLYTLWKNVEKIVYNDNKIKLKLLSDGKINSNKCRRLALRLFNKAGLSTLISKQIQNCSAVDPILIRPAIVLDAVRQKNRSGIKLEQNARWNEPDVDYTPYNDIISAVWPTLRHRNYTWGLLEGPLQPTSTLYSNPDIIIPDPCSHPSTIICGQSDKEYINIKPPQLLKHGRRYHVCLHADSTALQHEKWDEDLEEINSCSDGITIDLSPPSGGRVWIQTDTNTNYQVSSNSLTVFWDSFIDVEDEGGAVHPSGVSHYTIKIGSLRYLSDVLSPVTVGLINHQVFHNLTLQNGHQYFATVTAVDFVNRNKTVVSDGIIIDYTAPEILLNRIQTSSPYLTSLDSISACWKGSFKDSESGIKFYKWSVGSRRSTTDILETREIDEDCDEATLDVKLQDGFTYYINVQAINSVGMSTILISRPLIVDTTPPITGLVFDGISGDNNIADTDYISNTLPPSVRWERFHDPHSSIKHYTVQIGTCPGCDDVLPQTETRTRHNFTFTNIRFISGIKYFTMVTGCNMAELCSSISSDGFIIDVTPPIRGHVIDGTRDADIDFQASRTFIGGKWYGFKDSESSIEKYEWRVGTSKGGSEILKPESLPVLEIIYRSNLPLLQHLPVDIPLYITVTAYNKAGLSSESTSDGFIIDTTPPTVTKQLTLSSTFASILPSAIICRTGFKVEWEFTDVESDIEHQYMSLSQHLHGDFNSSMIEIPSVLTEYVFSGLSLHDGSKYNVKVIGCNLAGLCTSSVSHDILVDTTPPTRGTFAIESNHAANIIRHPGRWIEWNTTSLTIAWLGFSDLHSGILYYLVSVGTKPFYTDLNKDGKAVKYFHEDGRLFENEGEVQIKTVKTAENLSHGTSVFLSIAAINRVGLKSQPIHNEFQLIHTDLRTNNHGSLVRRCRPYNCEGHCVCSEQDTTCSKPDGCITNDSDIKLIQVIDVTNLQSTDTVQTNYTPTNMFLSAKWRLLSNATSQPIRYEVSIGLSDEDHPSGVFDSVTERHWFDVGQDMGTIVTLPKDKTLNDNMIYSVFVKAWYDDKRYYVYKSPGLTVISKPPTLTYLAVKELEQTTSNKDIDYQINNNTIIVGWKDKFNGGIHGIDYYQVYISTHPQGHNIYRSDTKVSPQQKSFSISGLKLQENQIYYSTVLAFNKAGFCSWSISDGIIIDSTPPSTGIIHDGLGPHDSEYQSSEGLLAASWYGFSDIGSGVVNYYWCVGRQNDPTTCDILPWTNVGLKIKTGGKSLMKIYSGDKIYHKVYAVDGSGLQSQVAVSNGIIIDTSPPEPSYLEFIGENLILNPSFESISDDTTTSCNSNIPEHWYTDSISCVNTRSSQHSTAHDGEVYITITDQIQQTIQYLDTDCSYQLTVHVGYPHDILLSHHKVEGFIRLGHEINSFKLNPDLCQGDCSQLVNVIHWYKFTYIYQPINTREKLVIGTTRNNMILAIDDLELRKINHVSLKDTNNNHIVYHPTFTPHWSSLHFNWYFKDGESSIVEYQWALGSVKGGTRIREFTTTGERNHVTVSNLPLVHNARLYFTVKARNGAGLITLSYSDFILVDTTPPVVIYMHDGTVDITPPVVIYIPDGTVDTTPPVVIYIHDGTVDTTPPVVIYIHDGTVDTTPPVVIYIHDGTVDTTPPVVIYIHDGTVDTTPPVVIYMHDGTVDTTPPVVIYIHDGTVHTTPPVVIYIHDGTVDTTPPVVNYIHDGTVDTTPPVVNYIHDGTVHTTPPVVIYIHDGTVDATPPVVIDIHDGTVDSTPPVVSYICDGTVDTTPPVVIYIPDGTVDTTPPVAIYIYDGTVDTTRPVVNYIHDATGQEVDYQTSNVIAVNWKIEDPESGIDYCLWAIGSVRGGYDIQKFTRIQKDENKASKEYTDREPTKVYSTIRCYNKVGLQVTVTTDGVQLIDSNELITSSGQITLLPQTTTQYQLSQYCLSLQQSLGIHWRFDSNSYQSTSVMIGLSTDDYKLEKEIDVYCIVLKVGLSTDDYKLENEMDETGINYDGVKLQGLKLKPGTNYMVNISGILLGRLNNYINQTFSTGYQPPSVKEDRDIKIAKTLDGLTLMISWTDIFESYWKDLTYEVSLGTNQGGGDVLQWQETKDDRLRLTLPKHWKYKYLYLSLTAVDPCGLFTTIQRQILI
ncbi:hypothetical protein LOTGIDRAFT_168990 [Lottia gigantea]|uniref:P-type domain-containing protein n=1 Tax=Lottia gigantea TaxID=225164 RepID=V4B5J1_LOTGI|nr:hypothetical protein LOTGIDRAFT_168990 [Lottia gigantea]ESO83749.1 hypothetical protein LOTGIDRAFT_168990 [Lottia gigantea]